MDCLVSMLDNYGFLELIFAESADRRYGLAVLQLEQA